MSGTRANRWVVKISGTPLEDPTAHAALWESLHALRESSEIVLVHGGGRAVDAHLHRLGMETRRIAGLRCTPMEQMHEIAGVLAGRVNKTLVSALVGIGCPAVGLSLVDGGEVRSSRVSHADGDLGCVGEVVGGEGRVIRLLAESGYLPVIASIGCDGGGLLNVNADDAAGGLAAMLECDGVAFLSDVAGVRGASGQVIDELSGAESERLIEQGVIEGGMIAKVRAASRCAMSTGRPAVIASFLEPERLSGLLLGESVGTRVVAEATSAASGAEGQA